MTYTIRIRRDVPRGSLLAWALALLLAPALVFWYRQHRFEYRRWLESDRAVPPRGEASPEATPAPGDED